MYLFTGSSSENPAMSVRYLYKVLGISARKCLDWHLYDLMPFNFVNNVVFLALVALYLPRVFLCKAMLDVDVGTFLVWGNKRCCHWYKALLVWAGLGWAVRQEAEPRASVGWGAVSEPQPARATQCLRCVLRLHVGLSLLFCEQRESGSSVLGESQDIEADSWRCQPGSLCKEAATMGLILVVWQKRSSALFSTDRISPDDFPIHIVSVSLERKQRRLWQFSGHSNTLIWHFCEWNFLKKDADFFIIT